MAKLTYAVKPPELSVAVVMLTDIFITGTKILTKQSLQLVASLGGDLTWIWRHY